VQRATGTVTSTASPAADFRPRWTLAKRLGFRFTFVYLALFILPFPLTFIPFCGFLVDAYSDLWDAIVSWAGRHVLQIGHAVTLPPGGSGDTTWHYIQLLCFLILASAAMVIWSLVDRRLVYERLDQWLRVWVRLFLASALIGYGVVKVIPVQMPAPSLAALLGTYGDSSPMGLLWTFMGASKGYQIFTGATEMVGGVLLLFPATALLGTIISIAATTQVFALNMCYDVPVKIYSFHLMMLGVFLIAPELRRLSDLIVLNRAVKAAVRPPLFARKRRNTAALAVQAALGIYIVGTGLYVSYERARTSGFLAPKPPMYGIWQVDEFTVNGQPRPPLLTDESRWSRLIFDFPGAIEIQLVGGDRKRYSLSLDSEKKSLTLTSRSRPDWTAKFSFEEPAQDRMTLEGDLDGDKIWASLTRTPASAFALTSRGFHWIIETPVYP
jgi:hypothetical protein